VVDTVHDQARSSTEFEVDNIHKTDSIHVCLPSVAFLQTQDTLGRSLSIENTQILLRLAALLNESNQLLPQHPQILIRQVLIKNTHTTGRHLEHSP
jgi:hypothetical protein